MKDRITLGRDADVAETAALTLADDRATDRIVESLDWEHDARIAAIMERRREERDTQPCRRQGEGGAGRGLCRCPQGVAQWPDMERHRYSKTDILGQAEKSERFF